MPKLLSPHLLGLVRAELAAFPEGCAIEDLSTRLANWASRRSLQRRLAQWVAAGQLRAVGIKKGRRYLLPLVYGGRKWPEQGRRLPNRIQVLTRKVFKKSTHRFPRRRAKCAR